MARLLQRSRKIDEPIGRAGARRSLTAQRLPAGVEHTHWIRRRHHRREPGEGDLSRERSASGRSVTVPLDTRQAHAIP